jgi:peptidoglycan/xylan/chitin deacetylase (PgdA/CDA1 family)
VLRNLTACLLVFSLLELHRAAAQAPPPAPVAAAPSAVTAPPADKPARSAAPGPAGKSKKLGKPAPPPKPVKRVPPRPAAYELLLTFDDGPRLDTTPKVLEALDQYGIKSVFFVNGVRFMGKGPQHDKLTALMRETLKRGHVIGNHTIHHLFLCGKRGPIVAEKEILDNAQLIRDAVGVPPPLFRTPFGSHCPSLSATLRRLAITPIGWDIDPQDWKLQNAEAIFEVMKKELTNLHRARSIILFHDVQPATIEMLPRFLKWVADESAARKARGEPPFKFIDYSFLLNRAAEPTPGAPLAAPSPAGDSPSRPPPPPPAVPSPPPSAG